MNILSLFTGIGGLDAGLKIAVPEAKVICCVEADGYCQRVLAARMADGSLDPCPIHGDVTTFDGRPWRGCVDLICGGFPCQDISNAGRRAGITGERSGLWFEYARIIGEVRPRYVFVENVAALLTRGLDTVLGSLAEMGFDAEWGIVSAADVGAPHLRKRLFILAHARRERDGAHQPEPFAGSGREANAGVGLQAVAHAPHLGHERAGAARGGWCGSPHHREPLADAQRQGLALRSVQRRDLGEEQPTAERAGLPIFPPGPGDTEAWREWLAINPEVEPAVCRVAARTGYRVDRLRALGNAVVPLQAALAFTILARRIEEEACPS